MSVANRKNNLYLLLSGIFLTNAITAEIVGVKIFSGETLIGIDAAQVPLFGLYRLDFNLTAGALIWPVVFITTDIMNEYFGKEGVKRISLISSLMIVYVFFFLWVATTLPPADFWLKVNETDIEGNPININAAYSTLFRQGLGIIIGSITAFLLGQFIDIYVFQLIKKFTGNKAIWLRATGSTMVSQLVDSYLVLFIAFYLLGGNGKWELQMVFAVGTINYLYKFTAALLLTPLLYVAHFFIDRYLQPLLTH